MFIDKKKILLIVLLVVLYFMFSSKEKDDFNIYYYDLSNNLVIEKVELSFFLNFLYKNSLGRVLRSFFVQKELSKLVSFYPDSFISKYKIKSFIKNHNINENEFLKSVSDFKNFNDFFVRKIKKESRNIDLSEDIITSPADSKLFVIPDISREVSFFVKNKKFNLKSFLNDELIADKYDGGQMLIFRLAPQDYHRYHFPFNCFANKPKIINGILESVNPVVYRSGVQPLYENERQVIELNSSRFGDVCLVSVGAMFVGKIINTFEYNQEYKKGDELGYFKFGGSTLVLLFEKDKIKVKDIFIKNSSLGYETQVLMGQAITC